MGQFFAKIKCDQMGVSCYGRADAVLYPNCQEAVTRGHPCVLKKGNRNENTKRSCLLVMLLISSSWHVVLCRLVLKVSSLEMGCCGDDEDVLISVSFD